MFPAAVRIARFTAGGTVRAEARISAVVISIGPSSRSNLRAKASRAVSPCRRTRPMIAATALSISDVRAGRRSTSADTAASSLARRIRIAGLLTRSVVFTARSC
jgi:hypothetical protein